MKKFPAFLLCFYVSLGFAAKPKHRYVKIETDSGSCVIMLYDETPLHRDNFVRLAKAHYFDGVLFHRVIKNFMIQGGDPESKTAKPGIALGNGSTGYTIPAEFRDSLFHKKGVIAAARDNNPEKASSGSQFYLVQGKKFTDGSLDSLEHSRLHFKIPDWQREVYKTLGGTPHLDRNYTVFGEIVEGLPLVDKIAAMSRDNNDRPLIDIKMKVSLLSRRQSRKIERKLR